MSNGGQTWQVWLDHTLLDSFAPPASATGYAIYNTTALATSTVHTLRFVGTNLNGGDNTVFIDTVSIFPRGLGWSEYPTNPFTFNLGYWIPDGKGGIFAHDLTGDGLMEFVITSSFAGGLVTAYGHNGGEMWFIWREDEEGEEVDEDDEIRFPNGSRSLNAPAAVAGDVNGDGIAEIMFLTKGGELRIHRGTDGQLLDSLDVPGTPEAVVLANLRGLGNRDVILHYSQTELRAIRLDTGTTLWHTTNWLGLDHSIVRTSDLTGNGLDEVIGVRILNAVGQRINPWNFGDIGANDCCVDSVGIADIIPGGRLELAYAEQRPNPPLTARGETIVADPSQFRWNTERLDIPPNGQCLSETDPDKVAIGEFNLARPGLEVFARSSCGNYPWIMDSDKQIFEKWDVPDHAPSGWYAFGRPCPAGSICFDNEGGIDIVTPVRWRATGRDHIAVVERHVIPAKTAIVNAPFAVFNRVFNTDAARLYVADVAGDFREEVIVVEPGTTGVNGRVKIFWNDEPNPTHNLQPRQWSEPRYGRVKQNYNYYSTS